MLHQHLMKHGCPGKPRCLPPRRAAKKKRLFLDSLTGTKSDGSTSPEYPKCSWALKALTVLASILVLGTQVCSENNIWLNIKSHVTPAIAQWTNPLPKGHSQS